jgi:hypothetical protein
MANEKVETLRQRKAAIEARIAAIEAKENAQRRREETRLRVLIGAAVLADSSRHGETLATVKAIVQRAFATGADRDRLFLKSKDWI